MQLQTLVAQAPKLPEPSSISLVDVVGSTPTPSLIVCTTAAAAGARSGSAVDVTVETGTVSEAAPSRRAKRAGDGLPVAINKPIAGEPTTPLANSGTLSDEPQR